LKSTETNVYTASHTKRVSAIVYEPISYRPTIAASV
jgi:hypothetical protein